MSDSTAPLERILALTRVPALAELHPDDLASLAERTLERQLSAGAECTAGDAGPALSLLLGGALEIGSERRRVEAPALVGAVESLAGVTLRTRAGDAGAYVLVLDGAALGWVMADVYEVWIAMLRHTAARWLAAERRVAERARMHPRVGPGGPLSLYARIVLLSRSELLGSLRAHSIGRLASGTQELRLAEGETLWEAGDTAEACFVLADGSFSHHGRPDDGTALPRDPGTVLGLREALAKTAREGRLTAASDARVLRLSDETLLDELEDDPEAAAALLVELARRTLCAEGARG